MTEPLAQYGLAGLCIIGLAWFIMYLMKEHKTEREEWRRLQERQNDEANRNINKNTDILSELTTLLKNRKWNMT